MDCEDSLKIYWDVKNSVDTAERKAKIGIEKAAEMFGDGEFAAKISKDSGLSAE